MVAGSLRCDVHPRKGRILLAEKTFACGTKFLFWKMEELGDFCFKGILAGPPPKLPPPKK